MLDLTTNTYLEQIEAVLDKYRDLIKRKQGTNRLENQSLRKVSRLTAIRRSGQPGFRRQVDPVKSGVFFMVQTTASYSVQGQRGGCTRKKRGGVPAPHSLNSFVFCGLSLLIGFPRADTEKSGETIATPPPKGWFLPAPIAALCTMPLSRPVGGRYRRYLSLREGSEKTPHGGANETENGPMELRKNYRKLTTALSRFWHRPAGPLSPRPE